MAPILLPRRLIAFGVGFVKEAFCTSERFRNAKKRFSKNNLAFAQNLALAKILPTVPNRTRTFYNPFKTVSSIHRGFC